MTAREYLENKYPQMRGDKWNTHDVIDDNWVAQMMTEFAEMEVKNISSKPMLADRLPNAEDVKRWYQLLVGKSEVEMQKDIEATLR